MSLNLDTLTPETPSRTHKLSDLSEKLDRNVFLWEAPDGKFQGGIRVDETTPVTVATFYRWIDRLAFRGPYYDERPAKYVLRPVDVKATNFTVFHYRLDPNTLGDALSRTDSTTVKPGDYGIFHPSHTLEDPIPCPLGLPHLRRESFAQEEARMRETIREWPSEYNIGEAIRKEAADRDQQCMFTGTQTGLLPVWIFPPSGVNPAWSIQSRFINDKRQLWKPNMQLYTSVQNVVTVCNRAERFFTNNQVGVDVDDNYRIRFFGRPSDHRQLGLLERLDLSVYGRSDNGPSDEALREHFEHSLYLYMLRGDVFAQYDHFNMADWIEDRGSYLSDPEWNTELGREVIRVLQEGAHEE